MSHNPYQSHLKFCFSLPSQLKSRSCQIGDEAEYVNAFLSVASVSCYINMYDASTGYLCSARLCRAKKCFPLEPGDRFNTHLTGDLF